MPIINQKLYLKDIDIDSLLKISDNFITSDKFNNHINVYDIVNNKDLKDIVYNDNSKSILIDLLTRHYHNESLYNEDDIYVDIDSLTRLKYILISAFLYKNDYLTDYKDTISSNEIVPYKKTKAIKYWVNVNPDFEEIRNSYKDYIQEFYKNYTISDLSTDSIFLYIKKKLELTGDDNSYYLNDVLEFLLKNKIQAEINKKKFLASHPYPDVEVKNLNIDFSSLIEMLVKKYNYFNIENLDKTFIKTYDTKDLILNKLKVAEYNKMLLNSKENYVETKVLNPFNINEFLSKNDLMLNYTTLEVDD